MWNHQRKPLVASAVIEWEQKKAWDKTTWCDFWKKYLEMQGVAYGKTAIEKVTLNFRKLWTGECFTKTVGIFEKWATSGLCLFLELVQVYDKSKFLGVQLHSLNPQLLQYCLKTSADVLTRRSPSMETWYTFSSTASQRLSMAAVGFKVNQVGMRRKLIWFSLLCKLNIATHCNSGLLHTLCTCM